MQSRQPPIAAKKIETFRTHGDERIDEYAWLRSAHDPAVQAYLSAENAYADRSLRPQAKLVGELYRSMKSRMSETDMSVPVKDGPYEYYTRVEKGKQYTIHCRKAVRGRRAEEIVLDENVLAKGGTYFHLGLAQISEDHTKMAYAIDTNGSELHTLRVRDLTTGRVLSDVIDAVGDVEWSADGKYIFYTKEQHPHPPRQVYRHELGMPVSQDVLVYDEHDPQWYVALNRSHDRRYIFVSAGSFDATEVRFLPATMPDAALQLFAPRTPRVKYGVEHHEGFFYIITNERAVEYKIMRTRTEQVPKRFWKTWMAHDPQRTIEAFVPFSGFFAVGMRVRGSEHICISNARRRGERTVPLPGKEHALSLWGDIEYESSFIRFTYDSLITPKAVYDYDILKKKMILRKEQHVPGWDASQYVSKRIWVKNGPVSVPVVVAYHTKTNLDGTAPLLLEAYGSYGITSDPVFSITKSVLLDRGWIIALAHPRGGGEMGQGWHEAAKKMTKHHTYEDVIAVTDYLVKKKYTARERMALIGGSAGGMMVGAVLNMRPDCVGAAIAYVPAADTLTSMLDETLGGTRLHYDEIGDPRVKKEYHYIKKWSPYEGVHAAAYPPLLVRCSLYDIRTPYWESAKWVARLRSRMTGGGPVFLKTEMSGGHFGKSGRYEWLKERAWDFAFLLSFARTRALSTVS